MRAHQLLVTGLVLSAVACGGTPQPPPGTPRAGTAAPI